MLYPENTNTILPEKKYIPIKYCSELKNQLTFFETHMKDNYTYYNTSARKENVFTNLNILYLNYFYFQINKEYNEKC